MGLIHAFEEQRSLGPTHGSISAKNYLSSPSGPQWTESELETELVIQLAFSRRVRDLVTQGVIRFESGGKPRRYATDVFAELWPDDSGVWSYFLIEVKPQQMLPSWREENPHRIEAAHDWCRRNDASFRIMTEAEIRTPHLMNARKLGPLVGDLPDERLLRLVKEAIDAKGAKASDLLRTLLAAGIDEPAARDTIDSAVANGLLSCDLSQPYGDHATVRHAPATGREANENDPFIRMLINASDT